MSSTALEVMMQQQEFQLKLKEWIVDFDHIYIKPAFDWLIKHTFPQRPITDDMRQMLDDLGIDWPEYQPISYDGLTFEWKR